MNSFLVDVKPQRLNFMFEVKKECSCPILLVNNTNEYVAFKVKTTSPKKYCVRPNAGIIKPKSTCEITVTMQPQEMAPPDMICKDKFLVQSTVVPIGTTDDNITSTMFDKGNGKYVEDMKLRVALVSPLNSPALSPMNLPLKLGPVYETKVLKDHNDRVETSIPHQKATKDVEELKVVNGVDFRPAKEKELMSRNIVDFSMQKESETKTTQDKKLSTANAELKPIKDSGIKEQIIEELQAANFTALNTKINEMKLTKDADAEAAAAAAESRPPEHPYPQPNMELKPAKNVEHLRLGKEMEEIKSKLNQLESKLSEAEVTVSKLAEERRIAIQEREKLKAELTMLRSRGGVRTVNVGFPLLFVCMVAFISVMLGYVLHP